MSPQRSTHVKLPPFQLLLERHSGEIHRFLAASLGPVEAEDAFQETFLSALRYYPKLRDASNLRAWLFQIAHRKALDMHRARARAPLPVEQLPEHAVDAAAGASAGTRRSGGRCGGFPTSSERRCSCDSPPIWITPRSGRHSTAASRPRARTCAPGWPHIRKGWTRA